MEVRPAELEDLRACAAISQTVNSTHVWQLTMASDPGASLANGELTMALRCLRLPRQVTIEPPGAPLDIVWENAASVFVATADEALLGFVALTTLEERPAGNIARLAVAPPIRRRGIGTALVRTAVRWAAAEGLNSLTAHCPARSHPAVAFYTRCGFTFTGYSEGYYPRGEVALFWQTAV
jgi:ribosomal protein S18 acetylase RimI-like enzyme